ncbi:hypothetical protein SSX86_024686 [Deinandra increscens subsp. villosa]|uniref:Uncharacterized protein n=1 Tax=Deinandra increscens subsp. villosa TaxID=3103831 RepID=A0AAP0CGC3_9ASTR
MTHEGLHHRSSTPSASQFLNGVTVLIGSLGYSHFSDQNRCFSCTRSISPYTTYMGKWLGSRQILCNLAAKGARADGTLDFLLMQVVDTYAFIGDVSCLVEKIQSFFMQEAIPGTHEVLKSIVLEVMAPSLQLCNFPGDVYDRVKGARVSTESQEV